MYHREFQQEAARVRQIAERTAGMIADRLNAAAREAGVHPSVAIIQCHNALVARSYGQPWPEVDYDKIARVVELSERLQRPGALAMRIVSRLQYRATPRPDVPRMRGDEGSSCEWADL